MNPHFRLTFPANPNWFKTIRTLLLTATKHVGFSEQESSQVSLAIDEALCNIYRHSYKGNDQGTIEFTFECQTSPHIEVRMIIIDEGEQVPLELIQSRELDEVRPGGLGVHLIKTIMDEATWSHTKNGMKLKVVKRKEQTLIDKLPEKKDSHVLK